MAKNQQTLIESKVDRKKMGPIALNNVLIIDNVDINRTNHASAVVYQQTIGSTKVDPDLCHNMA